VRGKVFIVLALVLAAFASAGPATAAGSKTFTDPKDDASDGPDITQLIVSNDDNGQLTFAFTFGNRPTILTGDDIVVIGIDADRRGNTGDEAGYEFIFGFLFEGGGQVDLGQWDGSRFNFDAPQTTLRAADGGRTISINRSELGNATAFDFRVATLGRGTGDTAPEGGFATIWTYQLQLRPEIVSIRASFNLPQPRVGKAFTLKGAVLRLSSGQEVPPTAYSCTATLGGKALRPAARCRWNIPKKGSKGKRFVVTVTASYGDVQARFDPYVFSVRA
jgi:hypothetical protein